MKEIVKIHGKECTVSVHQKSPSVWEATGTISDATTVPGAGPRVIDVKDRSYSGVLLAWKRAAEYWSN